MGFAPWLRLYPSLTGCGGDCRDRVRKLRIVNYQDVALTPEREECGIVWLPSDAERWRAEFVDDGPDDRLGFWCSDCWELEFGL